MQTDQKTPAKTKFSSWQGGWLRTLLFILTVGFLVALGQNPRVVWVTICGICLWSLCRLAFKKERKHLYATLVISLGGFCVGIIKLFGYYSR